MNKKILEGTLEEIIEKAVYKAVRRFLLDEEVLGKLMESVISSSIKFLRENNQLSPPRPQQKEQESSLVKNVKKQYRVNENEATKEKTFVSLGKYSSVIDKETIGLAMTMSDSSEANEMIAESEGLGYDFQDESEERIFKEYQKSLMEESVSDSDIYKLLGMKGR